MTTMRFSRRRLGAVAAGVAAVALVLSGCSAGGGGESAPTEGDFSGTTLNVAAAWSGAE